MYNRLNILMNCSGEMNQATVAVQMICWSNSEAFDMHTWMMYESPESRPVSFRVHRNLIDFFAICNLTCMLVIKHRHSCSLKTSRASRKKLHHSRVSHLDCQKKSSHNLEGCPTALNRHVEALSVVWKSIRSSSKSELLKGVMWTWGPLADMARSGRGAVQKPPSLHM